jgi:hypothetical protein
MPAVQRGSTRRSTRSHDPRVQPSLWLMNAPRLPLIGFARTLRAGSWAPSSHGRVPPAGFEPAHGSGEGCCAWSWPAETRSYSACPGAYGRSPPNCAHFHVGRRCFTDGGTTPTRFPTMLAGVHRGPGPSVTWADCDGWVLADAREPRRMRPHLSPAGPAGRCQQRRPHPAGCTASGSRILTCGPRGLTALVGAEPAVIIVGWLPRPGEPSSRSQSVTGGGARPTRTQRRTILGSVVVTQAEGSGSADHPRYGIPVAPAEG